MLCPACKSSLSSKTVYYCRIHPCSSCSGIWLSSDIFPRLASMLAVNIEKTDDDYLSLFKPRQVAKPGTKKIARLCPQCQVGMHEFNFAYDSNIFLDRCSRCSGVWTDSGEILKVANHLKIDPRIYDLGQNLIGENQAIEDINKSEAFMLTVFRILQGLLWL